MGAKSESDNTPTISNKAKAAGFVSLTPKHDEEEVKLEEEVEDEDEEEADPIIEPYDSFTLDKVDSLNYHQLEDNKQPRGSKGRFSGKDLMKFIPSTKNKYCMVIYDHSYLQLLHSVFICGD